MQADSNDKERWLHNREYFDNVINCKSWFSFFIVAVIMIIIFPLVTTIALAIMATGQNPIFVQKRIACDEKLARVLKFRTLWCDDTALFGGAARSGFRRRCFGRISAILRETGLDELPQFINVAKGDMALIGPRPLTPEDYNALPPHRRLRCRVRPGITGLAQVNGGQALDPASKLLLDIYFIENDSPLLRGRIIGRTVARLLGFGGVACAADAEVIARARRHAERAPWFAGSA